MKTIDAHHHFWRYNTDEFGWLSDDMARLRRDYLPGELKSQMDDAGVDAVVSVEARATLDENDFLLGMAEQHDWICGVVGKTPLAKGGAAVREHLETLLPQPKLVGVRDVLQGEKDGFTRGEPFNEGLAALKGTGLRFDLCILEHQLPEVIELVDRHTDQVFVLDHIAKPRIKDRLAQPWADNMKALAEREHVYCKLSGLVTEADWSGWTEAGLEPYMDTALETFGPHRLMLGTDWPVCRLGCEYGQWVGIVRRFAEARLSDVERVSLMGGTAVAAYGLELG